MKHFLMESPKLSSCPSSVSKGLFPMETSPVTWFRWYKGKQNNVEYKGRMHKQFYNVLIFHVKSDHTYVAEKKTQHTATLDDSEDSDMDAQQDPDDL